MSAQTPKTVVYEPRDGAIPDDAIDGTDWLLPDDERLTEAEKARPPLVDWPRLSRPPGWGSPLRRADREPSAA